jgi:hypothetical protein
MKTKQNGGPRPWKPPLAVYIEDWWEAKQAERREREAEAARRRREFQVVDGGNRE